MHALTAYVEVGRLPAELQDAGLAEVHRRAARRGVKLQAAPPRGVLHCDHATSWRMTDEHGVRICAKCTWPSITQLKLEALSALATDLRRRNGIEEE